MDSLGKNKKVIALLFSPFLGREVERDAIQPIPGASLFSFQIFLANLVPTLERELTVEERKRKGGKRAACNPRANLSSREIFPVDDAFVEKGADMRKELLGMEREL
jgi:hypothetical protein